MHELQFKKTCKNSMTNQTLDKLGYKPSLWNESDTLEQFMNKP